MKKPSNILQEKQLHLENSLELRSQIREDAVDSLFLCIKKDGKLSTSDVVSFQEMISVTKNISFQEMATGPPRQATGSPWSGAPVGVGMLRGAGNSLI